MARLLTGKLDVSKIDKSKIFEGKKGKYIDVSVWINDEVDNYGNIASVQQYMGKDATEKNYIGNLKDFKSKTPNSMPDNSTVPPPSEKDEPPF